MIDDNYIINKFFNSNKQCCISPRLQHITNEEKNYLLHRFSNSDNEDLSTIIKRIYYKIEEFPICPICKARYCKYDNRTPNKSTATCCDKYCIAENWKLKQKEILSSYNVSNWYQLEEIKNKIKHTNLERYGVEYPAQNSYIYSKVKQTMLERYGVTAYIKTEYGNSCTNSLAAKLKGYETKRKNHTFNKSTTEDKAYKMLSSVYPNIVRQYRSKEYPFNCDFYIPELELYIEFNGNWTHGDMPFDLNDVKCKTKLEIWKSKSKNSQFYKNAINTWTIRDVNKRETAKKNNLNYIEFWSLDKVEEFVEQVEDDPQNYVQFYKNI